MASRGSHREGAARSPGPMDEDLPSTLRLPGCPGEDAKVCSVVCKHMLPHRKVEGHPYLGILAHTKRGFLSRAVG